MFDFLSHEKPCQSSTEAHAALPNIAAPPRDDSYLE
jgi:hypothetical protein